MIYAKFRDEVGGAFPSTRLESPQFNDKNKRQEYLESWFIKRIVVSSTIRAKL